MTVIGSLVGVAGLAAVTYGVWLIYEPAGFMAGGVAALFLSWRLS